MASRNSQSGAQAPQSTPEPEPTPVVLGALAESTHVVKSERVFVDAPEIPRVLTHDGRVCAVQREMRADGSLGPFMLAQVRKTDTGESAQRHPVEFMQAASDAYARQGITLLRPWSAERDASESAGA